MAVDQLIQPELHPRIEETEPPRAPFLDAPNLLSLSRVALAGAVWLVPSRPAILFPLVLLAGITDMLDGWVARRLGRRNGAGIWLDPLCDKVFMLSLLAVVWVAKGPPAWLLPLIGAREIVQLAVWLAHGGGSRFNFRASPLGKLATVLQFTAVATILLDLPGVLPVSVVAGIGGAAAGITYGARPCRSGS